MVKKLILIIPGILTDIYKSGFSDLSKTTDRDYDIKIYNVYRTLTQRSTIKGLVIDLKKDLNKLAKKYKDIFIITHSSGSELILQNGLNKNIKFLVFWSPAMFFPQQVVSSLKTDPKNSNLLITKDHVRIGKKLAKDLDGLNTKNLIKNIKKPYLVYLSKEDLGHKLWPKSNYLKIPYGHNYLKTEKSVMLKKAKVIFSNHKI